MKKHQEKREAKGRKPFVAPRLSRDEKWTLRDRTGGPGFGRGNGWGHGWGHGCGSGS